jgi:hypothetical protein
MESFERNPDCSCISLCQKPIGSRGPAPAREEKNGSVTVAVVSIEDRSALGYEGTVGLTNVGGWAGFMTV